MFHVERFIAWEIYCAIHYAELKVLGYTCQANHSSCRSVATHEMLWPGQRAWQRNCAAHIERWRSVADAMGFVLHERPILLQPVAPDDAATRFAMMELV